MNVAPLNGCATTLYLPQHFPEKHDVVREVLTKRFGGYTVFKSATGGWADSEGVVVTESIWVYSVAEPLQTVDLIWWKRFGQWCREAFNQQDIFLVQNPCAITHITE